MNIYKQSPSPKKQVFEESKTTHQPALEAVSLRVVLKGWDLHCCGFTRKEVCS